ncbi:hypothetical protein SK128_028623 [Halocaridina rubra]|uniref:SAM domain-containing protein n=1 Tax=Halocaridina rubra TaxID=373956 RepID=A0AAN8WQU2_HALRR
MDPVETSGAEATPTSTPQVIELVTEETVLYELVSNIRVKTSLHIITSTSTSNVQLTKKSRKTRASKPIAIVYPLSHERKRSPSIENEIQGETKLNSQSAPLDEKENDIYISDLGKISSEEGKLSSAGDSANTTEGSLKDSDKTFLKENTKNYSKENLKDIGFTPEEDIITSKDPCICHRNRVQINSTSNRELENRHYCYCPRRMECANEEGCIMDNKEEYKKETPITDCLEEFLSGLHLVHLADYFKVLGCMCVRDLRLLEVSELEAIQLISRRRLLQHLDSITLHHEAPPADCSLEAWLTWYGLTHISGFLAAIGVHTVGDLGYLREDDLQLLKPVTRRRILTCKAK